MSDEPSMSGDNSEEITNWLENLEDELEDTAGTNDYLEVVERAEESSKHAENLANIAGKAPDRSTARSNS